MMKMFLLSRIHVFIVAKRERLNTTAFNVSVTFSSAESQSIGENDWAQMPFSCVICINENVNHKSDGTERAHAVPEICH